MREYNDCAWDVTASADDAGSMLMFGGGYGIPSLQSPNLVWGITFLSENVKHVLYSNLYITVETR